MVRSRDGGATWTPIGGLTGSSIYYRFAFDPSNLDHLLAATVNSQTSFSIDGGRTWSRSAMPGGNVLEVVVSPADSRVVRAQGVNFDDQLRHLIDLRMGERPSSPPSTRARR